MPLLFCFIARLRCGVARMCNVYKKKKIFCASVTLYFDFIFNFIDFYFFRW